jgi:hypothetical protein
MGASKIVSWIKARKSIPAECSVSYAGRALSLLLIILMFTFQLEFMGEKFFARTLIIC